MEMAVSLEPSFHRAIGYPFLMRLTGWIISNWPIVILQGFLVSVLSFRLVKLMVMEKTYWFHFLLITVLSFTTSMSWYAAQLMPDIFTFITAMVTLLILLEPRLRWNKILVYGAIFFAGLTTHLSHIPLVFLVLISLVLLKYFKKVETTIRQWSVISAVIVAAFVFTCTYNAISGFGFRLSMASNVFITANLGEMGILKMYLDENCPNTSPELCAIKDELPLETGGYLWDAEAPVKHHPEGWKGMNADCAPIVHDFLTKPRYMKWLIFAAFKATFKQMFQVELGSGLQYTYGDGSPPSWPMHTHFEQELNEYLVSVQNKDASHLPIPFFKAMNYISLFLSILIIGWAVLTGRMDQRLWIFLSVCFLFYVYNAAITGVLANVYERLQTRLLPLFPMLALVILIAKHRWFGQSSSG